MADGKDKTYYEMTPEQALDKLDKTVIGDLELKIVLTKALEKQIPKKPKNYNNVYPKDLYECSVCECGLRATARYHDTYCPNCGHKIDWEE